MLGYDLIDAHAEPDGVFKRNPETTEERKTVFACAGGYPADGVKVPNITKKHLEETMHIIE